MDINREEIKSICTYISRTGMLPKAPDKQDEIERLKGNGCIYLGHAISATPKFEPGEHTYTLHTPIPIGKTEEVDKWYINRDKLKEAYNIEIEY